MPSRFYGEAGYRRARVAAEAAATVHDVQVPGLIGRYDRRWALAFDWIDGTSLAKLLRGTQDLRAAGETMERVGGALAALHATAPPPWELPTRTAASESVRLADGSAAVGAIVPASEPLVRRLAQALARRLKDDRPTFLHGDFYDAQVLIGDDRVAFLDFDEACVGLTACDVGNFMARLHAAALVDDLPGEFIEALMEQLLAGYGATRDVADAATDWSVAALLRLAPESFRLRRRDWHAEIKAIVARAELMLQRASPVAASPRKTCEIEAAPAIESDAPLAALAAVALNLREMGARLSDAISTDRGPRWRVEVLDARLVRHKPGRRCLVEYDLKLRGPGHVERCSAMAKIRAKGFDAKTFEAMKALRGQGFDDDSRDRCLHSRTALCCSGLKHVTTAENRRHAAHAAARRRSRCCSTPVARRRRSDAWSTPR